MLTWPLFFIIILWYAKWLAWIGTGLMLVSVCVGISHNNRSCEITEEDKDFVDTSYKYFLVFGVSAIVLSILHILLVCHFDAEAGLMYVLGKDYVLSKGASSLIPKIGKLIESAADSLR